MAVAPKNTTRRVPTLRELDEDLKYSVPSAADGLDMSLLTKTLVPPEMVSVPKEDAISSMPVFLCCVFKLATAEIPERDATGSYYMNHSGRIYAYFYHCIIVMCGKVSSPLNATSQYTRLMPVARPMWAAT